jgi:hypothetical protein
MEADMSTDNPLSKQAAKASWITPLLAFGLIFLTSISFESNPATGQIIWLVSPLFFILGLGFGIFALLGIKKYGKKDILIPSIVGVLLNIGALSLVVLMVVAAFQRAAG